MLFVIIMPDVHGQNYVSKSMTVEKVSADSVYFLGDWVIASSIEVRVDESVISPELWNFNERRGTLIFLDEQEITGSVLKVSYQVLPLTIDRSFQLYSPVEMPEGITGANDTLVGILSEGSLLRTYENSDIRQSGSVSRGIIVGNNQDFSLESALNFELSGMLTENIRINASLTDQNIPIQPDGTTQNLREFDQVFIQLEAPQASIEMGDVDVSFEKSSFARLNRRLQGASGNYYNERAAYGGAFSVIRGTYKSMQFNGQEGVQGPYRLLGRNGEEFVMILAGTEKVYLNGVRQTRGAENDYIVDYGIGEITFTNNVLIKEESRITVEYEYIDQNFNRTLAAAEGEGAFMNEKIRLGASVIRQADGDELLSQRTLTQNEIRLLQNVGDDLDAAIVSGADIATEEERERFVMYAKIDTVINGNTTTIYKYKPGSPESIYRVRFSKVDENQGSYRRVSGSVNGLLFEWVGQGNGSYEPFRPLPAPQKHQMASIWSNFDLTKNVQVYGEWTVSDFDLNRFSQADNDDNTDFAYLAGFQIADIESPAGKIDLQYYQRFKGDNFEFFERVREVEFDRKWDINRTTTGKEQLNEAVISLKPNENLMILAEAGILDKNDFSGTRIGSSISTLGTQNFQFYYKQDYVESEDEILEVKGRWFRQDGNIQVTKSLGDVKFTPYTQFEHEIRNQKDIVTDSLHQRSQLFFDIAPGLNIDLGKVEFDISAAFRDESAPLHNEFQKKSTAFEQRYRINYTGTFLQMNNNIRWRNRSYTEEFREQGFQDRQSILVRSSTAFQTPGDWVNGELLYQVNTKRQALLQESYIEVGPEIGQYVWDDINGDGVQQVDEFFPEISTNEGTFIRQFLPSDEFIPVADMNVRYIQEFKPFKIGNSNDDGWFSDILLSSRVDIVENSTTDRLSDLYLLNFSTFQNDSTTIQGRVYLEQEIDLLPSIRMADLSLGYSENRSLNQRTNEQLKNLTNQWYMRASYKLTDKTIGSLSLNKSKNRSLSNTLTTRNFSIESFEISPSINSTVNRNFNIGGRISYLNKKDVLQVPEASAKIIKVAVNTRTYLFNRLQTVANIEIRNTNVQGLSSVYGNFELTEGTGEGLNLLWNFNSTLNTRDYIRLSLNYDGRTSQNRNSIHTIKLVVSANF